MFKNISKNICLCLSLASVAAVAATATPTNNYKLDPAASTLTWYGKKPATTHDGKIKAKAGSLEVVNNEVKGGNFEIDMASITDRDVEDPTYNAKLVQHLKSPDFFEVEKYPTAKFTITGVKKLDKPDANQNTHEITGDLALVGQSHPVTFPAKITVTKNEAKATGDVAVDRTKYGIKFKSKNIFKDIGDNFVEDVFTVHMDLVAKK